MPNLWRKAGTNNILLGNTGLPKYGDSSGNCCCGIPCNNCEGGTPGFITVGIYDLLEEVGFYAGCVKKSLVEGEWETTQQSDGCTWIGNYITTDGCPSSTSLTVNITITLVPIQPGSIKLGTRANVNIRLNSAFGPSGGRLYTFSLDKLYESPEEEDMNCFTFDGSTLFAQTASPTYGASPRNEAGFSIGTGPSYITLTGHS